MNPLLLRTPRFTQVTLAVTIAALLTSAPATVRAEESPTKKAEIAHLESMDQVLRAEEEKLVAKLAGKSTPEGQSIEFAGLLNPNTRFSISPKVPAPSTVVRVSRSQSSRDPSVLQLKQEIEQQRRSIKKLDTGLTHLNKRSMKIDAAIDFAQDEVLQIRTGRMLTSLKADSLHEKVSAMTKAMTIAEMQQEEAPRARTEYQLPRRNRRVVTGTSEQHPGSSMLHGHTVARAVINAQTVPLRSGPAKTFNEIFRSQQDDVVEIERRYEDWYRIIHVSGARGWVRSQYLLFGETPGDIPGKVIRIRGYDPATDRSDWEPEES